MSGPSPLIEIAAAHGVPVIAMLGGGNKPEVRAARAALCMYLSDMGFRRHDIGYLVSRRVETVNTMIAEAREAEVKAAGLRISRPFEALRYELPQTKKRSVP